MSHRVRLEEAQDGDRLQTVRQGRPAGALIVITFRRETNARLGREGADTGVSSGYIGAVRENRASEEKWEGMGGGGVCLWHQRTSFKVDKSKKKCKHL